MILNSFTRKYVKFYDFVKNAIGSSKMDKLLLGVEYDTDSKTLLQVLGEYYFEDVSLQPTITTDSKVNTLLCTYIFPEYQEMCCYFYDTDSDTDDNKKAFLSHMIRRIKANYLKYAKLIEIYESEKTNLMKQVSSIQKFNDTPQGSGDFSGDTHTTTITQNATDVATKIARIGEIESILKDYYEEWSRDVGGGIFFNE